jgi:hypothetical protein
VRGLANALQLASGVRFQASGKNCTRKPSVENVTIGGEVFVGNIHRRTRRPMADA